MPIYFFYVLIVPKTTAVTLAFPLKNGISRSLSECKSKDEDLNDRVQYKNSAFIFNCLEVA